MTRQERLRARWQSAAKHKPAKPKVRIDGDRVPRGAEWAGEAQAHAKASRRGNARINPTFLRKGA